MVRNKSQIQPMGSEEYREILGRFQYAQEGFAIALGYSGRAGQRWAANDVKVPGAVAVILRLLKARPELASVLEQIAPMPEARKQRRGRVKAKPVKPAANPGEPHESASRRRPHKPKPLKPGQRGFYIPGERQGGDED